MRPAASLVTMPPFDISDRFEILGHRPAIRGAQRALQSGHFVGDRVENAATAAQTPRALCRRAGIAE